MQGTGELLAEESIRSAYLGKAKSKSLIDFYREDRDRFTGTIPIFFSKSERRSIIPPDNNLFRKMTAIFTQVEPVARLKTFVIIKIRNSDYFRNFSDRHIGFD